MGNRNLTGLMVSAVALAVMVGCAAMPVVPAPGGSGGSTTTAPTTSTVPSSTTVPTPVPTVPNNPARCYTPPAPGVDWSQCNLTGRHFFAVDLRGANLSGAILTDVVFEGGCYRWVGPCTSSLVGANVSGTMVLRTDFGGVDMSGVKAHNVWFMEVGRMPARLAGADLDGSRFRGLNLGYIPIPGTSSYYSVDFTDANLIYTEFRNTILGSTGAVPYGESVGARFVRANLSVADLTEAYLTAWCDEDGFGCSPAIDFTGANFTKADLTGARVRVREWNIPSAGDPIFTGVRWSETICSHGFEQVGTTPCP